MSPAQVDRQSVIEMLASYQNRAPGTEVEAIDSLELAWLIHQCEQKYGVELDLDDDQLGRMSTVTAAVDVLRDAMREKADS